MPKYATTVNGQEITFEAANPEAAAAYIDHQILKGQPAHARPGQPDRAADMGDPKLAGDIGTLLGNDPLARTRVESQIAGRRASGGATVGLGLQQGTLRNFGDEIGAAGAASGLPTGTPPIISAPVGAARMLFGDQGAKSTYEQELQRQRGYYEGATEAHPVAAMGGEIAGGLAGPVGSGVVGTVGTAAADAALGGAGAGEDLQSRGKGAAMGAATGGLFAGALAGGQRILSGIYGALAPTARNIEGRAADEVTQGLRESAPPYTELADLSSGQTRGQPTVVGDVPGGPMGRLAQATANKSPEADRILRETTGSRFENQGERARTWWGALTGQPDTLTIQEGLRTAARAANKPLYDAAYARGASVWTPELQTLTTSPTVQAAMRDVTRTSADEAALAGQRVPVKNPFREVGGVLALPAGQSPSLQFWDHVQRNLRAQAEAAPPGGAEAARINQLRSELNRQLDTAVPEFGHARSVARGFFGSDDALEAGKGFLDLPARGGHAEERAAYNTMNPAERELFAQGVTESVRNRFSALKDNQEISRVFNSPEMRDRLRLALGPDRAGELEQYLKVEKTMSGLKNALGNSTTARQLRDMGVFGATGLAAGGGLGWMTGDGSPVRGSSGGVLAGAAAGFLKGRVDVHLANRMAQMLTSDDPAILRNGINILRKNATLRNAFDSLSTRLAAVTGQQTGESQAGSDPPVQISSEAP
jgi:hypothetical protein